MAEFDSIKVELGERSYEIIVGDGILDEAGSYIKKYIKGNSAFIITSDTVKRLYGKRLIDSLKASGFDTQIFSVEDGEGGKDIRYYISAIKFLSKFDEVIERVVFLINFGGGVVGDLGGFVAGSYRRGIPYVQIPTTLLAMADSGIGGKTGIDFLSGKKKIKNKIGVFHQPSLVLCDISLLKTLSKREWANGLCEVIKHGAIKSPKLFSFVEENIDKILNREMEFLFRAISLSYRIKAEIVSKDERETSGLRTILNYGHTIGHAVETASNMKYLHGESVSIGIVCENDIAVKMGFIEDSAAERIENLLMKTGLPVKIKGLKSERIMSALKHDKKFMGKPRMVLLRKLGVAEVVDGVSLELIKEVIRNRGGKR